MAIMTKDLNGPHIKLVFTGQQYETLYKTVFGEIMKQAIVMFAKECCSTSIQLKLKNYSLVIPQ